MTFIPQIFMWGSCFGFCIPTPRPPPSARDLSHTHNFVTHTQLITHTHIYQGAHNMICHFFHCHMSPRSVTLWDHIFYMFQNPTFHDVSAKTISTHMQTLLLGLVLSKCVAVFFMSNAFRFLFLGSKVRVHPPTFSCTGYLIS